MAPILKKNAEDLGVDCFLMGYNGGSCLNTAENNHSHIYHLPLPDGAIDRLIEYSKEHNHYLNVYHDGFVKGCPNDSTRIYPETYSTLNLTPYHYVDDIDELKGLNPTKALFIKHDDNERNAIYEHVMEEKLFTDLHLSKTLSHDDKYYQVYLEFMHPEVNKGSGLKRLCEFLEISTDEVISFGDAGNDIELLATAGMGICMAQGTDEAKKAATRVSQFTNDQHAIYEELKALAEEFYPGEFPSLD